MIFNSPEFIFVFLPALGIVLFSLYKLKLDSWIVPTLLVASIFFYLFSSLQFAAILCSSVFINFFIGKKIQQTTNKRFTWLIIGIVINVGFICLFKYTSILEYFLSSGSQGHIHAYALPLGISFYTFTQMGYLFDQYEGAKPEKKLINYALFASFFPSVSSGPIIQYENVGIQLANISFSKFNLDRITRGGCLLLIGMFKKVILADYVATLANSVYNASEHKVLFNSFEAWVGALSYSLQLYFDFSGYSDIAVGLGWMVGITLPWNFNSPYKAVNIIDFWRRWHISLTNWLNNYVFEPVNYFIVKKIKVKNFLHINIGMWGYLIGTTITMFICGLWHGATLNFILWGFLNVVLIFTNRFWKILKIKLTGKPKAIQKQKQFFWTSRLLTFICVSFSWVLFRSPDLRTTKNIWNAMIGGNGIYLPDAIVTKLGITVNNNSDSFFHLTTINNHIFSSSELSILLSLIILLFIVFFLPNSREVMTNDCKFLEMRFSYKVAKFLRIDQGWQPTFIWIFIMSIMLISLFTWSRIPDFLYFNF